MKKLGQLMDEMGFKPESSNSVKEAFIKHLIKNSIGVDVRTPSEDKEIQNNQNKIITLPTQLEFNFADDAKDMRKKA